MRSITNVFATDPVSEVSGLTVAPPAQTPTTPQAGNTASPVAAFENLARQTRVPVNILMAEADRAGTPDARAVATRAAEWQTRMSAGQSIEDIAVELVPDDPQGFLQRAVQFDQDVYGAEPTTPAPPPAEAGNSALENTGRSIGASVTRAGAGLVKAAGVTADAFIDFITQQDRANTVEELQAYQEGREVDATKIQAPSSVGSRAADVLVAPINKVADNIEAGRDADLNEEIAASRIEGNLFDPSTWAISEDATLRGLYHQGVATLGDLLPVVATAIATRSPTAAAAVGGGIAGGQAAQEGRRTVEEAFADVDANGVSRLERESETFQSLVARGMEPQEAASLLATQAERFSAQAAAAIGGLGGAATQKIVAPAAGGALANTVAGRAALSAVEEGAQEVAEGVASRAATNAGSGLQDSVTDGTLEEAALGAVAGGTVGAATAPFTRDDAAPETAPEAAPAPAQITGPDDALALPAPPPADPLITPPPAAPSGDPIALGDGTPPKGRVETLLDATSPPIVENVSQGETVTAANDEGDSVTGTYVGETVDGVTLDVDGERVDVPREEITRGAATISADIPIPPAPTPEPLPDRDPIEERQLLYARLDQIADNIRDRGATQDMLQRRTETINSLRALPVPTLPVATGASDGSGAPTGASDPALTVIPTDQPDFETVWPAPDQDRYEAAAREGLPVPITPQEVVDTAQALMTQAHDIREMLQDMKPTSPRAPRLFERLDAVWDQARKLWSENTVRQMEDHIGSFFETPPPPGSDPEPAEVSPADAIRAALDEAKDNDAPTDETATPTTAAPQAASPESDPATVDAPAEQAVQADEGETIEIADIRTKAAVVRGMAQDSPPSVGNVRFTWDAKENGFVFSRKHKDKVAEALGTATPQAETPASGVEANIASDGETETDIPVKTTGDSLGSMTINQARAIAIALHAEGKSTAGMAPGYTWSVDQWFGKNRVRDAKGAIFIKPDEALDAFYFRKKDIEKAAVRKPSKPETKEPTNPYADKTARDNAQHRDAITLITDGEWQALIDRQLDANIIPGAVLYGIEYKGQGKGPHLSINNAEKVLSAYGFEKPSETNTQSYIRANATIGSTQQGATINLRGNIVDRVYGMIHLIGSGMYPFKGRFRQPNAKFDAFMSASGDAENTAPDLAGKIEDAAAEVAPNPTDGQKKAGNYKKGRFAFQGMQLVIETVKGGERSGTGADGKRWSVKMPAHYGDIKGTTGADGDPVDFYMGDDPDSDYVAVVDQVNAETGAFDEHKVILGTTDRASAEAIYKAGFNDGKGDQRLGAMTDMTVADLKAAISDADKWTNPFALKPAKPKTAKAAAKSAASNTASAATNYVDGLMELFGGSDTLSSGLTFSKETYAKAKPFFDAAMKDLGDAKADIMALARALVSSLTKAGMDAEARERMEPYLTQYLTDVQTGEIDPFADAVPVEPDTHGTISDTERASLVTAFLDHFNAGKGFKSIVGARNLAKAVLQRSLAEREYKALEEVIEETLVIRAREIAGIAALTKGDGVIERAYDALVELYNNQPLLAQRTSTSVDLQAYSTPAPLAYVASKLAGIDRNTTVLEPTAGTGMLVMAARPQNTTLNELNPDRAAALARTMPGATITTENAAETTFPAADVVIMNPPFGVRKDNGKAQTWPMGKVTTREIDHAIAMRQLDAMPDDGSAVLLLGGVKKTLTGPDRVKGYRAGSKNAFYKTLYEGYNVVDHFTVDGDLYKRQGAAWPVDVVVIRGRGASSNPLPQKEAPPVLTSWDEIKGKLDLADSLGTAERITGRRGDDQSSRNRDADTDASSVANDADRETARTDRDDGSSRTSSAAGTGSNASALARKQGTPQNRNGDRGPDGQSDPVGDQQSSVSRETIQEGSQSARSRDTGKRDADGNADANSAPAVARENTEVETDYQVRYTPRSNATFAVGTLVPTKMRDAMNTALSAIEDAHGNIDDYVADALGYSRDELLGTDTKPGYFSAEQVDALAMAISNVGQGKGFIVGDQTGVGKGRFVAAMLRYAERQGAVPVFVTKDPGLYADMVRDLRDIGEATAHKGIMPTNNNLRGAKALPLSSDPKDKLEGLSASDTNAAIDHIAQTGTLPDGMRYLFTTYPQLQTVKGKEPKRRDALRALSTNAIFVLDESHEAGGGGTAGDRGALTGKDTPPNRAEFIRDILSKSKGSVFSSATYAKNPEVMSLYATTDLGIAVDDINQLGEAITQGGVPLQQVVANQLVEAGQYARRERSFDGVEMNLETMPVDLTLASNATALIADIFDADVLFMEQARKDAIEAMKEQGFANTPDGAVGVESGTSTSFASVVQNVVSQMLLALKVDSVAKRAIAAHKEGKKPIIAVYNTNGALLDTVVEDAGLSNGDAVDVPFTTILHRYVDRLRRINVRDSATNESKVINLTDDVLPSAAVSQLKALHERIDAMDLGDLTGAPLDALHDKLRAAGVKSGEITGRSRVIEDGKLKQRDNTPSAKKKQMFAYNKGDLDALIINQSGSTGYSMHATDKPDNDGKKRMMIIMQADPNIDVFMQMLGRIHRTGQTELPEYAIAVSDLAVEKRVSAILMRKMASLNANTTASKDSAVSLDNVVDFLNEVGDKVVQGYLQENADLATRLDIATDVPAGLAQKMTGRLAIMPPDEAETIYREIEDLYTSELAELDALGENPLEAQVFDWDAKVISSTKVAKASRGTSPFAKDTVVDYLDVKRLQKPYTKAQLDETFAELHEGAGETVSIDTQKAHIESLVPEYMVRFDEAVNRGKAEVDALEKAGEDKTSAKMVKTRDRWQRAIDRRQSERARIEALLATLDGYKPGSYVVLQTPMGAFQGRILDLDTSRLRGNPTALSAIRVRVAVADAARDVTLPLSRLDGLNYALDPSTRGAVNAAFETGASSSREVRAVASGNLINAVAKFGRGQVVFYTDDKGETKTGVAMPKGFDLVAALDSEPVTFKKSADVGTFLQASTRYVTSSDGMLTIETIPGRKWQLTAKAKAKGYYVDRKVTKITGEWTSRGSAPRRAILENRADVEKVIDVYMKSLGTIFVADAFKDKAREITGQELPDIEVPGKAKLKRRAPDRVAVRQKRASKRADLQQRLVDAGLADKVSITFARSIVGPRGAKVDGYQVGRVIALAMDGDAITETLDHEIIHALRDPSIWGDANGAFTTKDWRALVKLVRNDPARLQSIGQRYPELDAIERMEEAVAELYADYRAGRDVETARGLFGRVNAALNALGAWLRGEGYNTGRDVLSAIADGTLARRAGPDGPDTPTTPRGARERRRKGEGQGGEGRLARVVNATIDASVDIAARGKDAFTKQSLQGALSDAMDQGTSGTSLLALVPGRPLLGELAKNLPSAGVYQRLKESMDALRNDWAARTDTLAKQWQLAAVRNRNVNDAFMDLMHDATLAGIDPQDRPLTRAQLDALARQNTKDDPSKFAIERNRVRTLQDEIRSKYDALPQEFKDLWGKVRDLYASLADDWDDVIVDNHQKSLEQAIRKMRAEYEAKVAKIDRGTGSQRTKDKAKALAKAEFEAAADKARDKGQTRINALRAAFESNRIQKPYFPLARFGNYYVTLKNADGSVESFSRFKSQKEQQQYAAQFEGQFEIISGVLDAGTSNLQNAVDPGFVAEITGILAENDVSDAVMDAIWQRYLETMPDMSLRTNRIHRKGRLGYNDDALRAFGSHMFHGAHQIARLKYQIDMDEALGKMRAEAEGDNRATHVVNEINKRHAFTMSPTNAGWTAAASSAAFIWYLGMTPAAALVNLTQTTIIGIPVMRAKFTKSSVTEVSAELSRAVKDFAKGKASAEKSKDLTKDERAAMKEAYARSIVDKTQAHDLAGLAETGIEYSPVRARAMEAISFAYHHAERANREVTFLASYRLARKEGLPHASAIDRAANVTWDVHFDYQNNSRPRFMQDDWPKVLLTFRNFNVNMLYRLVRDTHQTFNGKTPEDRLEARRQLLGITGSMAAQAGIRGVWGYNLVMMVVGMFFPGGDDEAEAALKRLMIGSEDPQSLPGHVRRFMGSVALNGVWGSAIGADLTERIGMPSLWFREPYKDMEGRELYTHYVSQMIGPVPSIGERLVVGVTQMFDGNLWRGAETAAPKAVRDVMRGYRYYQEGVTTYRNEDPVVPDISAYQAFVQAVGFTPAEIAEQYEINRVLKNAEGRIESARSEVLAQIRKDVRTDGAISDASLAALRRFNTTYPEWPVTRDTIKRSLRGAERASENNVRGVNLNQKLERRLLENAPPSLYN